MNKIQFLIVFLVAINFVYANSISERQSMNEPTLYIKVYKVKFKF